MNEKNIHVLAIYDSASYEGGMEDSIVFEAEHFAEGEFIPHLVQMTMEYLSGKVIRDEYEDYEFGFDSFNASLLAEMLDEDTEFADFLEHVPGGNIRYLGHEAPVMLDLIDDNNDMFNRDNIDEIAFALRENE